MRARVGRALYWAGFYVSAFYMAITLVGGMLFGIWRGVPGAIIICAIIYGAGRAAEYYLTEEWRLPSK